MAIPKLWNDSHLILKKLYGMSIQNKSLISTNELISAFHTVFLDDSATLRLLSLPKLDNELSI